jgi:hypothetical protein
MEEFHEKLDRNTPFERKYFDTTRSIKNPYEKEELISKLVGKQEVVKSNDTWDNMNPNPSFVEAYNKRYVNQKMEETKKKNNQLYNEEGNRFSRVWEYDSFKSVHDPLGKFY